MRDRFRWSRATATVKLTSIATLIAAVAIVAGDIGETSAAQLQPPPPGMVLPAVPLVAVTTAGVPGPLPAQGRWFLVLIRADCARCETLLSRIQTEAPAIAPRLVIVVSRAAPADVAKMMSGFVALEPAAWFADQPGALSAALQSEESPLVLAMNDRSIRWTLADVVSGTGLRDVLTGWVTVPGR
jgi:hypothetical protein